MSDVAEKIALKNRLYSAVEDVLAAGVTLGELLHTVESAYNGLQADRMTARDLGQPDPYPWLGDTLDDEA